MHLFIQYYLFTPSVNYTFPFLSFFHKGSRQKLSHIPVSGLIRADTVNQTLSFERGKNAGDCTLGFSCFFNQFRIGHPGIFPQTVQYSLFQITYMVIYLAIFLAR